MYVYVCMFLFIEENMNQSFIIKLLDKPVQVQFIQFAVLPDSRSHAQMLTEKMILLDVNTFHTSLVVISNNN